MSRFGKWENIENDADYRGSGVYRIALVNSNKSPVEIARFLDKDKLGILQIGSSKDIQKRVKQFRGAMKGKRYGHAEGRRLNIVKECAKFKKRYQGSEIHYCFNRLRNKSEAQKEERRLLKRYLNEYGEIPPLNRRFP